MAYILGKNRKQPTLLPPAIEDYVDDAATVRVVDAFVDALDLLTLGFVRAVAAGTGRPGYNPGDLLKLYIYGYLNEIRSSRRLERECKRNVELMWLTGRLAPDHKTIADFQKDNGSAIVAACRTFVLFCRDQGLFAANLVAIDGSKFRAAASSLRVMDRRRIAEETEKITGQIEAYLTDLDRIDVTQLPEQAAATAIAIATLRSRQAELSKLTAHLDQDARTLVVDREVDARPMGFGNGGKPPSYNVQTVVDADTGFVIHHEVTGEVSDNRMLHVMAKAAKDLLGHDQLTVVADMGYASGFAAAACEADNIVACVPVMRSVNNRGDGTLFDRSAFSYDPVSDRYICPAGRELRLKKVGKRERLYVAQVKDCSVCPLKTKCTQADRRWLSRHPHEEALTRMGARVVADPNLMRRRRCSVEHPFGTLKRMMSGRFLTKSFKGTRTEMALSVLAYNMIRSFKLKAHPA